MGQVYDWCWEQTHAFETLEVQEIQDRSEKILEAVAKSYTFVSGQHKGRSKGIRDKQFEMLMSAGSRR